MKPLPSSVVMTLMGLVTATVVIAPLLLFERSAMAAGSLVRLHDIMFFFVLPAPAILIGFASAFGYYIGALLMRYRPGRVVSYNIVLFSVALFVGIHYLEFLFVLAQYGVIPEEMGFGEFLYRDLFHSDITLRTASGRGGRVVTPGALNLLLAPIRVGGYAVGALGMYQIIRSRPYCDRCGRFMRARTKQVRYTDDEHAVSAFRERMTALGEEMDERELDDLIQSHTTLPSVKNLRERRWRSVLWHKECDVCKADSLEHQGYIYGRRGWEPRVDMSQAYAPGQIRLDE